MLLHKQVVSGVPKRNGNNHVTQIATISLYIFNEVDTYSIPHLPAEKVKVRMGIHSGPVVAGVIGSKRPRYDLFGPTVQIAKDLESLTPPGMVLCSDETFQLLNTIQTFEFEPAPQTDAISKYPKKLHRICGRKDQPKGTFTREELFLKTVSAINRPYDSTRVDKIHEPLSEKY
eukprot:Sdes_comp23710_c0_seq1m21883